MIRVIEGDPSVVFWVVIEIMHLDSSWPLAIAIRLYFDSSGFEPTRGGMICIYTIVGENFLAGFPLRQNAIRAEVNILVISAGPARIMKVGFVPLDVDDFSVDPLILSVTDIDVLSEVEPQSLWLIVHNTILQRGQ